MVIDANQKIKNLDKSIAKNMALFGSYNKYNIGQTIVPYLRYCGTGIEAISLEQLIEAARTKSRVERLFSEEVFKIITNR